MAVSSGLTGALKKVVLDLEDDLRARVESPDPAVREPGVRDAWTQEHQAAVSRERTAMSWQEWRDDRLTQAAVAWVLTTVFVRFCEDNQLLKPVWIAGPTDRRQEALDAELAYFRAHPEHTDREWLQQAVEHLRATKATKDLVEAHSPRWTVSPSGAAAKRLIAFWRERTADGELVWDLADPHLSTRFLGDLYQDLSEYAKKTFALLQTPEFVEEFILDQTMEPALAERPLKGFRLIDPTCGSGHFLLGAFARLNDRWAAHAPGLEVQARVQQALDAIHGVDLNPFAVAIARFRLLVAALRACDLTSLEAAPGFAFHLAAGDSLLHGAHQMSIDDAGVDSGVGSFLYAAEDREKLAELLSIGSYDVVVGNPPYITVEDPALNSAYRELYETCQGKYPLSVPFVERFFQLSRKGNEEKAAGWIGQITSNSFMRGGYGRILVRECLPLLDLRRVIDCEGVWIPGHNMDGTPTVILVGRNQAPVGPTVRTVLGKGRREKRYTRLGQGGLWTSLVQHLGEPGYEDSWISVRDVDRRVYAEHPWTLSGHGAPELLKYLKSSTTRTIANFISPGIGRAVRIGADDVFVFPRNMKRRFSRPLTPYLEGHRVRDYLASPGSWVVNPYVNGKPNSGDLLRELWPWRNALRARRTFAGLMEDAGKNWWEYMQFTSSAYDAGSTITFAHIASCGHFASQLEAVVFNRHAPVIKLLSNLGGDVCGGLLATLNSSVATFWLRERSQPKGGAADIAFSRTYEINGGTVAEFPLPGTLPTDLGIRLQELAATLKERSPETLVEKFDGNNFPVAQGRDAWSVTWRQMVALQEEADWAAYAAYGLAPEDLAGSITDLPPIWPGECAFEIAMCMDLVAHPDAEAWLSRPNMHRQAKIRTDWPSEYQDVVGRRISYLAAGEGPACLLERPEYKRRWETEPWEKRVEEALRGWLLDRLEAHSCWFDGQGRPVVRSVAQLADVVSRDADLVSALELWFGLRDSSATQQLLALLGDEGVPFLAAYRLTESGLRKRGVWEHTWALQRREDQGEKIGTIPVPPNYTNADFRKQLWWKHRDKFDVPKERFILYPSAGRETDSTPLLGWAGWNHAEQALALAAVIAEREGEGWADERLVPLVAGLAELQPWVRQWHDETDPTYQLNLADYLDEELRGRAHQVGQTLDQLGAWRPAPATRGRRPKA